ncbi:MAG: hypothetical protein QF886_20595, partial [Planctomycetota bacterium]|nr:hypothetical protein [Planctomycetota bacterium]
FRPAGRKFYVSQWTDPVSGKLKTKSTKCRLKKDADRFAGDLAAQLREGSPVEWPLEDLSGGAPFRVVQCRGSRLALVEFRGALSGLMQLNLRKVKESQPGIFTSGQSCGGAPNPGTKALSVLNVFRKATINGKSVRPKSGNHSVIEDGAVIDLTGEVSR